MGLVPSLNAWKRREEDERNVMIQARSMDVSLDESLLLHPLLTALKFQAKISKVMSSFEFLLEGATFSFELNAAVVPHAVKSMRKT